MFPKTVLENPNRPIIRTDPTVSWTRPANWKTLFRRAIATIYCPQIFRGVYRAGKSFRNTDGGFQTVFENTRPPKRQDEVTDTGVHGRTSRPSIRSFSRGNVPYLTNGILAVKSSKAPTDTEWSRLYPFTSAVAISSLSTLRRHITVLDYECPDINGLLRIKFRFNNKKFRKY